MPLGKISLPISSCCAPDGSQLSNSCYDQWRVNDSSKGSSFHLFWIQLPLGHHLCLNNKDSLVMTNHGYLTYTVNVKCKQLLPFYLQKCSWKIIFYSWCAFFSHVYNIVPNRTDQEIQTYTIAVINALFLKAPDDKRQVSWWGLYTCAPVGEKLFHNHTCSCPRQAFPAVNSNWNWFCCFMLGYNSF